MRTSVRLFTFGFSTFARNLLHDFDEDDEEREQDQGLDEGQSYEQGNLNSGTRLRDYEPILRMPRKPRDPGPEQLEQPRKPLRSRK